MAYRNNTEYRNIGKIYLSSVTSLQENTASNNHLITDQKVIQLELLAKHFVFGLEGLFSSLLVFSVCSRPAKITPTPFRWEF